MSQKERDAFVAICERLEGELEAYENAWQYMVREVLMLNIKAIVAEFKSALSRYPDETPAPAGPAPCPSCGKPWDMKKFDACECGAVIRRPAPPEAARRLCPQCRGTGLMVVEWDEAGVETKAGTCDECNGRGFVEDRSAGT